MAPCLYNNIIYKYGAMQISKYKYGDVQYKKMHNGN